jgi:putative peptidoglycan lipid II flippase
MKILAPGFQQDPVKYRLAVDFSTITFPYLALISITALQTGVLNAQGKFGPGAAAPIAFNIVLIAGLFLARAFHWHVGYTQSWAFALSGVVQMVWLMISCARAGVSIPWVRPVLSEEILRLFRRIGPGAIGAGAAQINLLISTMLASMLPTGAVSHLFYADRLNQLPIGVIGVAVGTTLLPVLTRHIEADRHDHAHHYMNRAIEFCLLLGLPATLGLAIAAPSIIGTLFEHGAFTHVDTIATAEALTAYALGIPAFLLVKVFAAAFFARHDTKTPVKIAVIAMVTNVLASLLLLGLLQHVGIALANSLAVFVNALLLFFCLRRKIGTLGDAKLRARGPKIIFCSAVMGVTTWGLVIGSQPWFIDHSFVTKIVVLGAVIGASSLVYGLLLQFTGAMRISDLRAILKSKD